MKIVSRVSPRTHQNTRAEAVPQQTCFQQVEKLLHEALAAENHDDNWYALHHAALDTLMDYTASATDAQRVGEQVLQPSFIARSPARKLGTAGLRLVGAIRNAAIENDALVPYVYHILKATQVRREGPCP